MSGTKSYLAQELSNFFEAAWLELPAAAGKVLLGAGDDEEFRQAGWKTYDAWVRLANEMTNAVYSNAAVGEATGRMMETALRLRQIGGTMAAAFFGNLWPSIGLSTHSEMVAIRNDLLALREELAAYTASLPVAKDHENSAGMEAQDTRRAIWKASPLNGYRAQNDNGNLLRRSANQGNRNVAA
jgi:hypothetical protein